jgi:hypothetical protein
MAGPRRAWKPDDHASAAVYGANLEGAMSEEEEMLATGDHPERQNVGRYRGHAAKGGHFVTRESAVQCQGAACAFEELRRPESGKDRRERRRRRLREDTGESTAPYACVLKGFVHRRASLQQAWASDGAGWHEGKRTARKASRS